MESDILTIDRILPPGFLSLMEIHNALGELFLLHQEALLEGDVLLATNRLREFEAALLSHIKSEEVWLLPVYARAGRIAGGSEELFTGEHKKMRQFISRFYERLEEMKYAADLKRPVLRLLDDEAMFKLLVEHHDAREENILYPTLDRVTSEQEKQELLARCFLGAAEVMA
jgi:hemerythrin-like domain-containing protein